MTPSEERIAQLVATGLTNREVADRAFISPKTVEANLARIYDKLGVHSRAELGRVMNERERALKTQGNTRFGATARRHSVGRVAETSRRFIAERFWVGAKSDDMSALDGRVED